MALTAVEERFAEVLSGAKASLKLAYKSEDKKTKRDELYNAEQDLKYLEKLREKISDEKLKREFEDLRDRAQLTKFASSDLPKYEVVKDYVGTKNNAPAPQPRSTFKERVLSKFQPRMKVKEPEFQKNPYYLKKLALTYDAKEGAFKGTRASGKQVSFKPETAGGGKSKAFEKVLSQSLPELRFKQKDMQKTPSWFSEKMSNARKFGTKIYSRLRRR